MCNLTLPTGYSPPEKPPSSAAVAASDFHCPGELSVANCSFSLLTQAAPTCLQRCVFCFLLPTFCLFQLLLPSAWKIFPSSLSQERQSTALVRRHSALLQNSIVTPLQRALKTLAVYCKVHEHLTFFLMHF